MQIQRGLIAFLIPIILCSCNLTNLRDQKSNTIPHPDAITGQFISKTDIKSGSSNAHDDLAASAVDDLTADEIVAVVKGETNDIWQVIRQNLSLPRHADRKSVKIKIAWYARNQEYMDRVAERATPYLYHIVEELEKRNMPLELALLPIVESAYQPFAYSPSRASGIWQFISSTGKLYGLKQNWWYDGRRDIIASTDAALNYLQSLHKKFNGNWQHALAGYNSGERNVERAIHRNRKAGKPTDFWSLRLPRETKGYIPSLFAVTEIIANPVKYNITLKPILNKPYFTPVNIGSQIDLANAARLAGMSMDEIYTLNPGFNRWATDPQGPHRLLVPVTKAQQFEQDLAALPDSERITWQQHKIKKGETLSQIAQRYRTSVAALKQTNRLRGNLIRVGQSLLIPTAEQPMKHYTLSADTRKFRGLKTTGDGEKYIYTIKRGDNLWDIGRTYGISVTRLCNWNGINRNKILRPGQKLTVWIKNDDQETKGKFIPVVAKDELANINTNQNQQIQYTVKEGDSLWLISRRFAVSVAQLCQWNQISKRRFLQPGQSLVVYIKAKGV
jgi:membrane-bound lytic murein transglycosylase D